MEQRSSHVTKIHADVAHLESCVYCGEKFDTKWVMHVHITNKHQGEAIKCWVPPGCFSYYLDREARDEHILTSHDPNLKHWCLCCEKVLPLEIVVEHRRKLKTKCSSCEVCGVNYFYDTQIANHVESCFTFRFKTDPFFQKLVLNDFQLCRKKTENCQIDCAALQEETLSETLWGIEKLFTFNYLVRQMKLLAPSDEVECIFCGQVLHDELKIRLHVIQKHNIPIFSPSFRQFIDFHKILERIELKCPHCGKSFNPKTLLPHLTPERCSKCQFQAPCEFLLMVHLDCHKLPPDTIIAACNYLEYGTEITC